jgi:hypothetical protein
VDDPYDIYALLKNLGMPKYLANAYDTVIRESEIARVFAVKGPLVVMSAARQDIPEYR